MSNDTLSTPHGATPTPIPVPFDPALIAATVKQNWMKENRHVMSAQERFEQLVPWLVAIIVVSGLVTSTTHTLGMMQRLVPNALAWFSIGFDVGLIGLAFTIYTSKQNGVKVPFWWYVLEGLIFVLILTANLAGSIGTVLSAPQPLEATAKTQALDAMFFLSAIIFSFIVPVINWVGGQVLAHLVLRFRADGSSLTQRWKSVAYGELYDAFYGALIKGGSKPGQARLEATRLAVGYTAGHEIQNTIAAPVRPMLSDRTPSDSRTSDTASDTFVRQPQIASDAQPDGAAAAVERPWDRVSAHLDIYPSDVDLPARALGIKLGVSPDTANRVQRARKMPKIQ